jgi:hypothetical protein
MELDSAPTHPFWPFSNKEAREAGLSFSAAVDAGLGRDRGLEYTLNPMLYVQNYSSFTPTTKVATAQSSSVKQKLSSKELVAQRAARRREALAQRSVVLAVQAQSSAPVESAPVVVSTQTIAEATEARPATDLVSLLIRHDGSFGREGEDIAVTALDAAGNKIEEPTFTRALHLRTSFGRAEFDKPVLTPEDFKRGNGMVSVRMKPIGETTIIIEVQPMGVTSKPMKYER